MNIVERASAGTGVEDAEATGTPGRVAPPALVGRPDGDRAGWEAVVVRTGRPPVAEVASGAAVRRVGSPPRLGRSAVGAASAAAGGAKGSLVSGVKPAPKPDGTGTESSL